MNRLIPCQKRALEHVHNIATRQSSKARRTCATSLSAAALNEDDLDQAIASIRSNARIALHFHPDRICAEGHIVAEGLLRDNVYKNQFETRISSGSPTAFPGGERDVWERRLFGGAYHVDGVSPADRPKYGSLDIACHPDGPSPRFGSCYVILAAEVTKRATFTYGGSQEDQAVERTGTLETIEVVIAPLLHDIGKVKGVLGVDDLTVTKLIKLLVTWPDLARDDRFSRPMGKVLDSFVEAQIHGPIHLAEDVEQLVADPAYRGTPMEGQLREICAKYDIALHWHRGFVLRARDVPDVFRGYPTGALAHRIAGDGVLDAAKLGEAAISLEVEPELWEHFGDYNHVLTGLRRLWLALVAYGEEAMA